jgi:hypothetical protein
MKVGKAIIGKKVGRLTIIKNLSDRNEHGKLLTECLCDCGKIVKVVINNLGNKTNSCGCLKAENINERMGKGIINSYAKHVLADSLKLTRDSDLTLRMIEEMIFSNCYYCERSPKEIGTLGSAYRKTKERIERIGIDRINNDIGYYISNIVPCCFPCNKIKSNLSIPYIINYYDKMSRNATEIMNGFKPKLDGLSLIVEHVDNCQCYTNKYFLVSLEDRAVKITRRKCQPNYHKIDLTLEQIKNIIYASECSYCNRDISEVGNLIKRNGYGKNLCSIRALGIDRINSELEYTIDNVVPCCKFCNYIKTNFAIGDFSFITGSIYNKIYRRFGEVA